MIGREIQLQKCTEEAQKLVSSQKAITLVIMDGVTNIRCLINDFIQGFDVRNFTLISGYSSFYDDYTNRIKEI